MKYKQIRCRENVHMGMDLTKNIIAGNQKGAKFPGLSMEREENGDGVTIKLHNEEAVVPWSNIIVAHVEKEPKKS